MPSAGIVTEARVAVGSRADLFPTVAAGPIPAAGVVGSWMSDAQYRHSVSVRQLRGCPASRQCFGQLNGRGAVLAASAGLRGAGKGVGVGHTREIGRAHV